MLGLKIYVGGRRGALKIAPGDVSNVDFGRATRLQMNAVEDVPVLMAGLLGIALLGMPAWYIHVCGGVLVLARLAHAMGLAGSGGFSIGRAAGTLGTLLTYLAIAGALIVHAFTPTF
jgi:hypothetical protein